MARSAGSCSYSSTVPLIDVTFYGDEMQFPLRDTVFEVRSFVGSDNESSPRVCGAEVYSLAHRRPNDDTGMRDQQRYTRASIDLENAGCNPSGRSNSERKLVSQARNIQDPYRYPYQSPHYPFKNYEEHLPAPVSFG